MFLSNYFSIILSRLHLSGASLGSSLSGPLAWLSVKDLSVCLSVLLSAYLLICLCFYLTIHLSQYLKKKILLKYEFYFRQYLWHTFFFFPVAHGTVLYWYLFSAGLINVSNKYYYTCQCNIQYRTLTCVSNLILLFAFEPRGHAGRTVRGVLQPQEGTRDDSYKTVC